MRFLALARGLGLAAIVACAAASGAAADNYDVKDGNGVHQSFAAKLVSGILHPFHIMEGLFGGVPTAVNMTNPGALDVTVTAGSVGLSGSLPGFASTPTFNCGTGCNTAALAGFQEKANFSLSATASAQAQAITPLSNGSTLIVENLSTTAGQNLSVFGGTSATPSVTGANFTVPPGAACAIDATGWTYLYYVLSSSTLTVKVREGSGGTGSTCWPDQDANGPTPTAQITDELHHGEVGGNQLTIAVTPTVTASSAYASGNAVGGLMTLANAARISGTAGASGTSGLLQSLVVGSKTAQTAQLDVFVFSVNPSGSTCTDKTAFALAAADIGKLVGVLSIPATTGWYAGGTPTVGQATNLALPYVLSSATTLYACAVTRGTPTFGSTSDWAFNFGVLRN